MQYNKYNVFEEYFFYNVLFLTCICNQNKSEIGPFSERPTDVTLFFNFDFTKKHVLHIRGVDISKKYRSQVIFTIRRNPCL